MSTSSPRCLRSSKRRCSLEEKPIIDDNPFPKRRRTPFDIFVAQEIDLLVDQREHPTISNETAGSIHQCLMKRWQTMSKEEMQLYEDLVLAANSDSDYDCAYDKNTPSRRQIDASEANSAQIYTASIRRREE